ncbi:HprK-related kinase A [Alteromonas sp. AMM-1]|uniref:HprK-related kinase A n=1 Tax=Alteromonas sp. AMM-1 TaxID=3394233 RepID=UPI0039A6199A
MNINYLNIGLLQADCIALPDAAMLSARLIYGDAPRQDMSSFCVAVKPASLIRRLIKPIVQFECNFSVPFKPLPQSQSYALLEWGLNWCLATGHFNHLLLHAAVLVKDGQAILFPAMPGSGKSTLTAWLGIHGWKVYSDEMAVIDLVAGTVQPLYRPICLKNQSIDLVKQWSPNAVLTPTCHDTAKGSVAHLKAHHWEEYATFQPARIVGVVFPKYDASATEPKLFTVDKLQTYESLYSNAFNYHVLGQQSFEILLNVVNHIQGFEVHYASLDFMSDFLQDELLS